MRPESLGLNRTGLNRIGVLKKTYLIGKVKIFILNIDLKNGFFELRSEEPPEGMSKASTPQCESK